jgi:hypothetical protein
MDPQLKPAYDALSQLVSSVGGILTLTSTIRTFREQSYLYDRYKKGLSNLPANPPGFSAHEYGLAFDAVTTPREWLEDVGSVWVSWGGAYGGSRDPVHFELAGAGQFAWNLGLQGYNGTNYKNPNRQAPPRGDAFYKLADFISGFVPGLGELQLVDTLVGALDGNNDLASWYLQHPAEALRDLSQLIRMKIGQFSGQGGTY